jgi:hypothetical protein
LYALYRAAGAITDEELMSYRRLDSRLEGHPTPRLPWVDVATGSLGLGLPVGVGLALAGKALDRLPYRVWVLTGDSELAEGSIWEAFARAGHAGLDNLIAIVDVNRLGQSGETMLGWDTVAYAARARAFGWRAIEIDGHDVEAIDRAYREALEPDGRPVAILARTIKGKGVAAIENRNGFHGKPLADAEAAIAELGGARDLLVSPQRPNAAGTRAPSPARAPVRLPSWSPGELVATRRAYGEALRAIGAAEPRVVAMEGEVGNSTYSQLFRDGSRPWPTPTATPASADSPSTRCRRQDAPRNCCGGPESTGHGSRRLPATCSSSCPPATVTAGPEQTLGRGTHEPPGHPHSPTGAEAGALHGPRRAHHRRRRGPVPRSQLDSLDGWAISVGAGLATLLLNVLIRTGTNRDRHRRRRGRRSPIPRCSPTLATTSRSARPYP